MSAAESAEERRSLAAALEELDVLLSTFEGRLRRGLATWDDHKAGVMFARQLGSHAATLRDLAASYLWLKEAKEHHYELELRSYRRGLGFQDLYRERDRDLRPARESREGGREDDPDGD